MVQVGVTHVFTRSPHQVLGYDSPRQYRVETLTHGGLLSWGSTSTAGSEDTIRSLSFHP